MNEDAGDISGWGLDEIRSDWAYVTNHSIDARASALHAERLATFDRALAAHDAWKRINQEPSDARVAEIEQRVYDQNRGQIAGMAKALVRAGWDAALSAAGGAR